jgi:hypothetical protein
MPPKDFKPPGMPMTWRLLELAGESTLATLAAVLDANPPPIEKLVNGVPPELAEVIHKCIAA